MIIDPCTCLPDSIFQNAKMQKCNVLIFNLLRNPSLRFLQKGAKKPCFDIPIIFSSLLSRIPINILDKAITTLLGYLIYFGADKILKNRINKNSAE